MKDGRKNNNPLGIGGAKRGEVRNPNGRPPNTKFFSDYVKIFAGLTESDILAISTDTNKSAGERLAAAEFLNALNGKDQSVERILQRTEGKVADKVEQTLTIEEFDESTLIERGQELAARLGGTGEGAAVQLPTASEERKPEEVLGESSESAGGTGGQP